jgi:hypothetical protein
MGRIYFFRKCCLEEAIGAKSLTGEVMLRKCVILTSVLVLGSTGASNAEPPDSPSMVYIDGLPCNSLCLSYLAWSRDHLSSGLAGGAPLNIVPPTAGIRREGSKHAAQARAAKVKPVAKSNQAAQAKIAGLPPAGNAVAVQAGEAKPAPKSSEVPQAKLAELPPAANAAAASEKSATNVADSHPKAGSAAGSNTRATQQQVTAAIEVALKVTAAPALPAPERQANNADDTDHAEAVPPASADKTAAASANDRDVLVALVMAGPEIKSVSDLAGKTIAIDDAQSKSNGDVRAAIVAAGALEVQLGDGQTKAIDRLVNGAAPAAVLALVSPEAAQGIPEIEGFTIFRILLSPRSLKAAADTPEAK